MSDALSIPDLLARATAIRAAAAGLPDALRGEVSHGAWKLEMAALAAPAGSVADVESKLRLWDELIEDPSSILEEHLSLWERLKADWREVLA